MLAWVARADMPEFRALIRLISFRGIIWHEVPQMICRRCMRLSGAFMRFRLFWLRFPASLCLCAICPHMGTRVCFTRHACAWVRGAGRGAICGTCGAAASPGGSGCNRRNREDGGGAAESGVPRTKLQLPKGLTKSAVISGVSRIAETCFTGAVALCVARAGRSGRCMWINGMA